MKIDLDSLTPKQIVEELDKYIVGQTKAKKAVAIALRHDADDLPPSSTTPRAKLWYCLRREQGFLVLERCIVTPDGRRARSPCSLPKT